MFNIQREIIVLLCIVVLGNGRYLSDDKANYGNKSDFDLEVKESRNTKREVDGWIPEDKIEIDYNKTESIEDFADQSTHKFEYPNLQSQGENSAVFKTQSDRNTFLMAAEFNWRTDNKYTFAFVPDYIILNGHNNARSESTRGKVCKSFRFGESLLPASDLQLKSVLPPVELSHENFICLFADMPSLRTKHLSSNI